MEIQNPYFDKIVSRVIQESASSDAYEKSIAANINDLLPDGWSATRPQADVTYPDVKITGQGQTVWVEVKMNVRDNLYNKRMGFSGGAWVPSSGEHQEIPNLIAAMLNTDAGVDAQIRKLAKQAGIKPSALNWTSGKNVGNVSKGIPSVDDFRAIFPGKEDGGVSKTIFENNNYPVSDIIEAHYSAGKAVPCPYIQIGDNFFKVGSADPLKLNVPKIAGTGYIVVRWSPRSDNTAFEIMVEIKLTNLKSESPFSVAPGTSKKNPFAKLK